MIRVAILLFLLSARLGLIAQCDPTPTATINYVSGTGAGCVWNYSYSISYSGSSYKSYQLALSCGGGAFTNITSCLSLSGTGVTTGISNNFTCSCVPGTTVQLQITYGTSAGNCGGGQACTEPVHTIVLPVKITSFSVESNSDKPCVKWRIEEETGTALYVVEYSSDGFNFETAGYVRADKKEAYTFCDVSARKSGFYRLKIIETNGLAKYSQVVKFISSLITKGLHLFPNPATNKLSFEWPLDGSFQNAEYSITDASGKKIKGGKLTQTFVDISSLPDGVFHFQVVDKKDNIFHSKFVKAGK